MIATLNGKTAQKLGEQVVIEVQGVGYSVLVTLADFGKLSIDKPAKLFIYEYLREDLHDLYGFLEQPTKDFFELLISVNGVGPRMALHILNIGSSTDVANAIAEGDIKFIQTAHGVGRRVAERMVVELKDKLGFAAGSELSEILKRTSSTTTDEAEQALVSLGLTLADARGALAKIDRKLPTEDRVKLALKGNSR